MNKYWIHIKPKKLNIHALKVGLGNKNPIDLKLFEKYIKKQDKILEVGCGTGRLGIHLIKKYDYIGLEHYKPYINFFKNLAKKKGIINSKKSILNISFQKYRTKNLFEIILFPWTIIGDFDKKGQIMVLKKVNRLLKPKGICILDNPSKSSVYHKSKDYMPTKFYYDNWEDKFHVLGFKNNSKRLYKTKTGRERELTILIKDS